MGLQAFLLGSLCFAAAAAKPFLGVQVGQGGYGTGMGYGAATGMGYGSAMGIGAGMAGMGSMGSGMMGAGSMGTGMGMGGYNYGGGGYTQQYGTAGPYSSPHQVLPHYMGASVGESGLFNAFRPDQFKATGQTPSALSEMPAPAPVGSVTASTPGAVAPGMGADFSGGGLNGGGFLPQTPGQGYADAAAKLGQAVSDSITKIHQSNNALADSKDNRDYWAHENAQGRKHAIVTGEYNHGYAMDRANVTHTQQRILLNETYTHQQKMQNSTYLQQRLLQNATLDTLLEISDLEYKTEGRRLDYNLETQDKMIELQKLMMNHGMQMLQVRRLWFKEDLQTLLGRGVVCQVPNQGNTDAPPPPSGGQEAMVNGAHDIDYDSGTVFN